MEGNNHNEEWKEVAPKLASLPKKQPFDAPEGYFDNLHARVMDKISILEKAPSNTSSAPGRPALLRWLPFASAAATLLIVVGLFFLGRPKDHADSIAALIPVSFKSLSNEQLFAFLEQEEIPEDQIVASLGPEVLPEVNIEKKVEQQLNKVSVEELKEYIEDIPLEDLENLL